MIDKSVQMFKEIGLKSNDLVDIEGCKDFLGVICFANKLLQISIYSDLIYVKFH